jgi:hypothetical protein
MLIRPLDFEQFGQGVNEKLAQPYLEWLNGSHEINENTQNKPQTNPK